MIPQKEAPLTCLWKAGCLGDNVDDWQAVFLAQGHIDPRHQWKMEGHVALVAIAKVGAHIRRPLVGFGQKHAIRIARVNLAPKRFDHRVGFRKVFATGTIALNKVRNRVHPQPVDAHIQPVAHHFQNFLDHGRIIEVQIGLVREKAVPIILFG